MPGAEKPLAPLPVLEVQLDQEILRSERMRVLILTVLIALLLSVFVALMARHPAEVERLLQGRVKREWVLAALGGFLGYELLALITIGSHLRSGRAISTLRRYVNAVVETSLPTVALLGLTRLYPAEQALHMWPVLVYFLFINLATLRLNFKLCVFTGLVAALGYSALVAFHAGLFRTLPAELIGQRLATDLSQHAGKALLLLACGVVSGLVAVEIRRRFVGAARVLDERNRILDIFGRHVSPLVADKLLAQKTDVSEMRSVCVMFLDIRKFTTFAEQRTPEEVVTYLNTLFDFMIESVNRHHGIVNKFLGDGFMAVFGAPLSDGKDCKNAVLASLEILSRIQQMCLSGRLPPTTVGIGLHAGEALTGSIGSAARKEYTIIGDVVNVAARIEALNRELGTQLLVSDAVFDALDTAQRKNAVARGPATLKGRQTPIELYQLD